MPRRTPRREETADRDAAAVRERVDACKLLICKSMDERRAMPYATPCESSRGDRHPRVRRLATGTNTR